MRFTRLLTVLGSASALAFVVGPLVIGIPSERVRDDEEGRAPHPQELRPSVEAAFQAESYARGAVALLAFFNRVTQVRLQVFHVGPEHAHTVGKNEMRGVPVTKSVAIGTTHEQRVIRIKVANWPSGLYFARLDARDGRVGFAPVVIRPRRLGATASPWCCRR
jgi:hypothetical protein